MSDFWPIALGLSVFDNSDSITDFQTGVDLIYLSAIDANAATPANDTFVPLLNPAAYSGNRTGMVWIEQITGGSTLFGTRDTTMLVANATLYGSTDADAAPEFQVNVSGFLAFSDSWL